MASVCSQDLGQGLDSTSGSFLEVGGNTDCQSAIEIVSMAGASNDGQLAPLQLLLLQPYLPASSCLEKA